MTGTRIDTGPTAGSGPGRGPASLHGTAAGPPRSGLVHLQVTQLCRTFNRRPVLLDLSFSVRPGEILVVTGPNGAGKSTLLRMLAGLLRPGSGEVRWSSAAAPGGTVRRRPAIGYLAPDLRAYEELTPAENLDLLGRIRGLTRGALRVADRLAAVGLDPGRCDRVGALSTGQQQRVKLALALLGAPEVLLLDEPGSSLDADGRRVLAEVVREGRRRGPVILATNDAEEMQLGDRELRLSPMAGATRGGD